MRNVGTMQKDEEKRNTSESPEQGSELTTQNSRSFWLALSVSNFLVSSSCSKVSLHVIHKLHLIKK